MTKTNTFRAYAHVVYAQLLTDCILLDTRRGTYFELNEVATETWLLLAKNECTIDEIHDFLLSLFEVPSTLLLQDIHDLITELLHEKLIEKIS